jgi:hypothetical protein
MGFSEKIKKEAKRNSHFKCCICELCKPLEVHHIVPEQHGGPDDIENAVALCAGCHNIYGGNPDHRKWIRDKRDFWYEKCQRIYAFEDISQLEKTNEIIEKIAQHEQRFENIESDVKILQNTRQKYSNKLNEVILSFEDTETNNKSELSTQINTISSVVDSTATAIVNLEKGIFQLYNGETCPKCGTNLGYFIAGSTSLKTCPQCKKII